MEFDPRWVLIAYGKERMTPVWLRIVAHHAPSMARKAVRHRVASGSMVLMRRMTKLMGEFGICSGHYQCFASSACCWTAANRPPELAPPTDQRVSTPWKASERVQDNYVHQKDIMLILSGMDHERMRCSFRKLNHLDNSLSLNKGS
jgi:hypothetical protein